MALTPQNGTVILVSGAWHVKIHCMPPALYFETAGYVYVPLPLPAVGGKDSTLEENVSAISNAIHAELAKPDQHVAVISHSAAGLIGTEAINRVLTANETSPNMTHRVRVIYLASMLEWGPIVGHLAAEGNLRMDDELGGFWCDKGYTAFYDDMSTEDARPFIEALTFQKVVETPVLSSEAWRMCDVTHVVCTKDKAVPPDWQVRLAEDYGMRIVKMDTAHCPFISCPQNFVDTIDGLLKKSGPKTG